MIVNIRTRADTNVLIPKYKKAKIRRNLSGRLNLRQLRKVGIKLKSVNVNIMPFKGNTSNIFGRCIACENG